TENEITGKPCDLLFWISIPYNVIFPDRLPPDNNYEDGYFSYPSRLDKFVFEIKCIYDSRAGRVGRRELGRDFASCTRLLKMSMLTKLKLNLELSEPNVVGNLLIRTFSRTFSLETNDRHLCKILIPLTEL
ncbi:16339_t:CDS:2, partial [Racocetra persica]